MAIHFHREEFERRVRRLCVALDAQGLDGLLLFKQESMYYLTATIHLVFVFSSVCISALMGEKY